MSNISESIPVYRNDIRQLRPNFPLEDSLIDLYIHLFKNRDKRICDAHCEVNNRSNYYEKRKQSLFFSQSFFNLIKFEIDSENYMTQIRNFISDDLLNSDGSFIKENVEEIYIIFRDDLISYDWKLLIININKKKVYYIDPIYNSSDSENIIEVKTLINSEMRYNYETIILLFMKKHPTQSISSPPAGKNGIKPTTIRKAFAHTILILDKISSE